MITFRDSIPNHPAKCLGVSGPTWDESQCRLCWLAAYNRGYRHSWGINSASSTPLIPYEQAYPCLHRGLDKYPIPGCGSCNGVALAQECKNPKVLGRCVPHGESTFLNNARAKGILVCSECGFREHEPDFEMLPSRFRYLLGQPPAELPAGWEDWKVTKVAFRDEFHDRCQGDYQYPTTPTESFPQAPFRGRGIVIGAGGERYFSCAWAVAYFLRKHGCFLPIQFWYLGPEELDPEMEAAANSVGIQCVNARDYPQPRILGGWELKPFAVIHCPFEEVLYLDADCLPTRDPAFLFDEDEYQTKGAIFWPDLPPMGSRVHWFPPDVWEMFGLLPSAGQDFESGQFVVNKARCWRELMVTMWLNEHSDFVYRHVYGDKSTYNLAWAGCDTDYAIPSRAPDWTTPCILQYDLQGELIFQHACKGKDFLFHGFEIPNIAHPKYIEEAHALLRRGPVPWSGRIYDRLPAPLDFAGPYTFRHPPDVTHFPCTKLPTTEIPLINWLSFPITLEAGGRIKGAVTGARRWAVDEDILLLFDKGKVDSILHQRTDPGGKTYWQSELARLDRTSP